MFGNFGTYGRAGRVGIESNLLYVLGYLSAFLSGGGCESTRPRELRFSVLEQTLQIEHRACQEGALHGIGEFDCTRPKRVKKVLDGFLAHAKLDDALRSYAERARDGNGL